MPTREQQLIRFGPFEVDLHTGELFKDGVKLKLQPQPIQVLGVLLERPGELITREEFRKRLWPADTFVDFEHSLNTAVKKLRQALGDEAETPVYIETLPRRGYRFVGKVEQSHAVQDRPPSTASAIPLPPAIEKPAERRRRPHLWKWGLTALVLLGLAIAGIYVLRPAAPLGIATTRRLTRTPYKKSHRVLASIVSDGARIYFREHRNGRWGISQVSTMGGDVSPFPVDYTEFPDAQDISPDLSQLLITDWYGLPCCRLWLAPLPSGPPRLIPNVLSSPFNRFTRDGKGVLYTNDSKELYEADLQGANSRRLFSASDITCQQQSPDGRRFRFTNFPNLQSTPAIWEVGTDGTNPRPLFGDPRPTVCGVWSPDGKLYAFHRWDGSRWNLWAVRESDTWVGLRRRQPVQLTFGPLSYLPSTFSRDSKTLYSLGVDAHGELAAYAPNSKESSLFLPGISATNVAFSRDGKWVAYVSYPDGVLWRSRIDGSERRQLSFPPVLAMHPRWSPDDKLIVFSQWFSMGNVFGSEGAKISVVPADGGSPMVLDADSASDPTWSPDGNSVAYGGCNECTKPSGIRILDLKTRIVHTIPESQKFYSPRWSPDGRHLVALSIDLRSLWVYSFADRRWKKVLASDYMLCFPEWSSDSKYVYVNVNDENIVRIDLLRQRFEVVLPIKDIAGTGWWGYWFGLTPDGKILLLRNIGSEDLYALDLQNP